MLPYHYICFQYKGSNLFPKKQTLIPYLFLLVLFSISVFIYLGL